MSDEPEMTPITPEESGDMPPKVAPFNAVTTAGKASPETPAAAPSSGVSTIKLKPVIRKPMIRKPTIGGTPKPAAPAAPAPAPTDAAAAPAAPSKKATQSLAAVSDQMPAQAVLRKTGIIAEGIITPAQQQAAKSKTSRISLESAIGVAPAKESPAPLKTIRLRRPTDLKHPAPSPLKPVGTPDAAPSITSAETVIKENAPTVATMTPVEETDSASTTQKKTLKLHRPSGLGVKRPTLGIKKPGESAGPAAVPSDGGDVPDMPADMGDVPELKPLAPMDFSAASASDMSAGVPGWVAALSLVTSIAALLVLGVVVYFLYQEGVGPVAGANEMPFIQM